MMTADPSQVVSFSLNNRRADAQVKLNLTAVTPEWPKAAEQKKFPNQHAVRGAGALLNLDGPGLRASKGLCRFPSFAARIALFGQ